MVTSHAPIVMIGIGELAGVFGRGFLRTGRPVYPVTRDTDAAAMGSELPGPELVMVTVAEAELHGVLSSLPAPWRHAVGLVQNELLPRDWEQHHIEAPTVVAVWFEKKAGKAVKVIRPSIAAGPGAGLIVDALTSIGIDAVVTEDAAMVGELVAKNAYILVSNIAGLASGGTVGDLWHHHRDLAEEVAVEVLDIQEGLLGDAVDRSAAIEAVAAAFEADPDHAATGRSAPERLQRALGHADDLGLAVPRLRAIAADEV